MESLEKIASRALNISIERVNESLSRDKTAEWDSFNHLILISEIEKILGIKFSINEVENIKSYKELKQSVANKKIQAK